jgi:fibronectin type 3 domain-containing protein
MGQQPEGVDVGIRTIVTGDSVHVYHNGPFLVGRGFNIYRQDPGGDDFQQLNEEPVYGIEYASQLPTVLGDQYEDILEQMDAEDPVDMFLMLRTDFIVSRLYSFVYPEVAEATGRLFVDNTAPIGQEVTYRIEFVNDVGAPVEQPPLERTVQLERDPILPPDDLEASHTGREVTLNWSYPTASEDDDDKVIRFKVYRMTSQGVGQQLNDELLIRDANRTNFSATFTVPEVGVDEELYVTAVNIAAAESEPSEILEYYISDNVPPGRVANVQAFNVEDGVEVTWSVAPELDVAGYNIYRRPRLGLDSVKVNDVLLDASQSVFTDETTSEGRSYVYQVAAVDTAGNEGPLSAGAHTRITDRTAPAPPEDVVAEYLEGGTIRISWEYPEPSPDFKTFYVLRRRYEQDTSRAFNRVNQENLRETTVVDSGLSNQGLAEGGNYQYKVVAVDSANNQSEGAFAEYQAPDFTAPQPPDNVSASNQDGIRVNLTWNSSTSSDVTSYRIYRAAAGAEFTLQDSVPYQQRYFRDEGVETGTEYVYRISAMDSLGNESERSAADTALVRDFTPPRVVRNVRTKQTPDGVQIHWEPVPADDLVGYRVYRSNLPTGVYSSVNSQPVEQTQLTHENPDQRWWYYVRALDTSGNLSKPSDPVQAPALQ